VLRARGSELEAEFAYGVVRQLFERRLAGAEVDECAALLAGHAAAVRPLLLGAPVEAAASDTAFAVLHGLYWLTANLASVRRLLIAVDDVQWADEPSLRWLAYLASRVEGLAVAVLVALRPGSSGSLGASLLSLSAEASAVVRPALLSEEAVGAVVRAMVGDRASDELCAAVWAASGGNPLYLTELLRSVEREARPQAASGRARFRRAARRRAGGDRAAGGRRRAWPRSACAQPRAGARCARGRVRAAPRGGDRWRGDERRQASGRGPGSA
jgi:hypothetical protein